MVHGFLILVRSYYFKCRQ